MQPLRKRISSNAFVYISSLACFLILIAVVSTLPIEFSGYRNTDTLAPIWYLITQTGGFYGGAVILLILFIYLSIHFKKASRRYLDLYIFMIIVFLTQIFGTGLSYFFVKEYFQYPRPSQVYFVEKGLIENEGKDFFDMPLDKKRIYLEEKTKSDSGKLSEIYPPILNSWINDSGFSFPSGHSQTSFFLGTILSFIIYKTVNKKRKYYCVIPLIWAILVCMSRVVIGIHYPMDVAAGAFLGMFIGFIIISLKNVNRIFSYQSYY